MFFEYTYTPNDKLSMIMGLRADNNNLFGYEFINTSENNDICMFKETDNIDSNTITINTDNIHIVDNLDDKTVKKTSKKSVKKPIINSLDI